MAEGFPTDFVHWNISIINNSFIMNEENNDLDFYGELETYWMSKVKLYVL